METKKRICPRCGATENQVKNGKNPSGTQKIYCKQCKKTYTPESKKIAYDEDIRDQALKLYYSGVSGRGVGRILGINKDNVYNWIKKSDNGEK